MNLEYMKVSLFETSYNKKINFFMILDAPVYTVYICIFLIALFTMHIVAKQLYRKLKFLHYI